jgi:hypothetical protein
VNVLGQPRRSASNAPRLPSMPHPASTMQPDRGHGSPAGLLGASKIARARRLSCWLADCRPREVRAMRPIFHHPMNSPTRSGVWRRRPSVLWQAYLLVLRMLWSGQAPGFRSRAPENTSEGAHGGKVDHGFANALQASWRCLRVVPFALLRSRRELTQSRSRSPSGAPPCPAESRGRGGKPPRDRPR